MSEYSKHLKWRRERGLDETAEEQARDCCARGYVDDAVDVLVEEFSGYTAMSTYQIRPENLDRLVAKLRERGIGAIPYPHALDLVPVGELDGDGPADSFRGTAALIGLWVAAVASCLWAVAS